MLGNYFQALAQGQLLSILLGTLVFGAGVVTLAGEANRALMGSFEAIYRSLESLISAANLFIPLLVFGMAALFASSVDGRSLLAMASFLWTFAASTLLLCGLALAFVWQRSGMPLGLVFSALKTPALISLSSTSAMAAIPDTIHAMSSRLGFSRGVTEFIVPVASIFVRCGSALYFAILLVFVAHMYGRPLGVAEGLLICGGAMLGAFASAGLAGAASLVFMGMALRILQLPLEAVLPLFLAIELLCEGPRNLLSFLLAGALVASVSEGLPPEKREFAETAHIESTQPIIFTFSRLELALVLLCVVLVILFITSAGVGYGMR
jgi:Na+/H+-dicarboxylate symporter